MNTLRKIGYQIHDNWTLIAIALIVVLHFAIGLHIWPWIMLPLGGMCLTIYAGMSSNQFFAPIRMFIWPSFKRNMIKRLRINNLFTYPAVLWIEIEGKSHFLRGGFPEFQRELTAYLQKTADKLTQFFTQVAEAGQNPPAT